MCWESVYHEGLGTANAILPFDLVVGLVYSRSVEREMKPHDEDKKGASGKGKHLEALKIKGWE